MKNYVELDKDDIQAIIADYYHVPAEDMDKRVEINLSIITEGFWQKRASRAFPLCESFETLKGGKMLYRISINSIDKVKRFNCICNNYDFPIYILSGRYVVDGKSIMGLFSLDLTQILTMEVEQHPNVDKFLDEVKEFMEK